VRVGPRPQKLKKMGLVESHPTISIKCCTSKKDIVRHMTQHSNNDEDHHSELRGIRNFVVSNKALTSVVSVDMKRPNRQSLLDYQDRIRCKIARQFASAPNELSIVHITDENSGEVLGLIRIESASKTKEVTLSILKPRHDKSDSISSSSSSSSSSSDSVSSDKDSQSFTNSKDSALSRSIFRHFIEKVCSELRCKYHKKRIRSETSEFDENLMVSCGFRRLKTQDSLKFYQTGHPKLVISLEKKLCRWDDVKHVFLLVGLVKLKRAFPVELLDNSSHGADSQISSMKQMWCMQQVILRASEQAPGDFFQTFLMQVMLYVYS
jgi:hypothetical protein